jgi:ABC-2 type transport system ATP-binding protein
MYTISFDRLTKRYGLVLAVDGLSVDVGPGRVTGFLGPNGSGKATTLRMLMGLLRTAGPPPSTVFATATCRTRPAPSGRR